MFGCAGRHSENRGVSSSTLQVNSRADLVTAHQKLDDAGIPHGEVTDLGDAGLRDPVLQRSRRSTPRVDRAAVLIAGTRRRSARLLLRWQGEVTGADPRCTVHSAMVTSRSGVGSISPD